MRRNGEERRNIYRELLMQFSEAQKFLEVELRAGVAISLGTRERRVEAAAFESLCSVLPALS